MLRWIGLCTLLLATWAAWAGMPVQTASSAAAVALPPVVLKADQARIDPAGRMAWLTDPGGTATLDEIRARGDFRPLTADLSAGFTHAAIWLRFDVRPEATPELRILEVANALMDDVRLYEPRADGSYAEHRSGEDVPRAQWEVDYRNPSFRLRFDDPQPRRYYLRLWSRNSMSTKILLWQPGAFAVASRHEGFNFGAYYGIYVLLLVFHLFFWFWTRDRLAGWYLPYVAINCLVTALNDGYVQRLTGIGGYASDLVLGVTLCMTMGVSTTFTLVQLNLATVMPRFVRYYQPIMWAIGIATSLGVLSGNYGAGVGLAQVAMLLAIVVMFTLGVRLALRGHKPARFYLFVFGIFYAAVLLRFVRNLGFLPPSLLTEYAVPVGALLHMTAMSLGITGHYNRIKHEMLAAQAALNESLEAQVTERTATLVEEIARREKLEQEMRRALEVEVQARQEQQDFVAMVSHEFRTPLAIINTVTQQLAANLDAAREKSLQRCANIRESARRMTKMMDEFLSLDRLGAELRMNRRGNDLPALLREVADEWEPGRLQVESEGLPSVIVCDAELLRVALRNLIANAMRHSPEDVPVRMTSRAMHDGGVEVTVADKGEGILGDEIPKLFQKYFRGRAAQAQPGAGLGLHLVDRIARLHGGSIRVESEAGVGSRFILTLPGDPQERHQSPRVEGASVEPAR